MDKEKKRFTLDRIEEGIAVCFDDNEKEYTVSADSLGLQPDDIFLAYYDGTIFCDVEYLKKETEEKKAEMQRRLNQLFGRKSGK